jgi:hypothetical protein
MPPQQWPQLGERLGGGDPQAPPAMAGAGRLLIPAHFEDFSVGSQEQGTAKIPMHG